MSAARSFVLSHLREGAITTSELADLADPNVFGRARAERVRTELKALEHDGLVERLGRRPIRRRGPHPWLWRLTQAGEQEAMTP